MSQHKIEQDIRTQEEAARIWERERAEALKWNAHAEYAAQYMQLARRKVISGKVQNEPVAKPAVYKTRREEEEEEEEELEQQIQEMAEAEAARETEEYELLGKRATAKDVFETAKKDHILREGEREMERLEDEREREREEAEVASNIPRKSTKNRKVPNPEASRQVPVLASTPRTVDPSYFGISTPVTQSSPPTTSQAIPLRPRAFTAQTYPRPQNFYAAQTPASGYGPPLSMSAYYQPQPLIIPSYFPPSRSSKPKLGGWSDWEFDKYVNKYKRIRDQNGYLQAEYYEDQDTAQIQQETVAHSSYVRYAPTPQYSAQYSVDVAPQYTGPGQADYFSQAVPSRPLSSRLSGKSDENG
jgi:hypothetical protein